MWPWAPRDLFGEAYAIPVEGTSVSYYVPDMDSNGSAPPLCTDEYGDAIYCPYQQRRCELISPDPRYMSARDLIKLSYPTCQYASSLLERVQPRYRAFY